MKLRTRLLLWGAALPTALLVIALVTAGLVFDEALREEHDRALLGQAAVEAVSLFDRAASPHLHLAESPLGTRVSHIAPLGAIYAPDGSRVASFPQDADVPDRCDPKTTTPEATLHTELRGDEPFRVLRVRVEDPTGRPHCLWLAASLAPHQREMGVYWRIMATIVAAAAAIALATQWNHARNLVARIGNLGRHMRSLRAGRVDAEPPPDPVRDELGELRDATAETTHRLAAARRMQDRLLADAAHELRTPLASMRAAIDVALRRPRSAEELTDTLSNVASEVERLAALATHLLDHAALKAAPVHRAPADLVPVVLEAVDAARMAGEPRGVVVELEVPERARGRFAVSAVRQAIDNLLANALQFSPEGGTITVAVAEVEGRWCIDVRDEGPGIAPDDRESIFEPFYRASRATSGKGLGLAIVREVAEIHEGFVRVMNEAEAGAHFRLCVGTVGVSEDE